MRYNMWDRPPRLGLALGVSEPVPRAVRLVTSEQTPSPPPLCPLANLGEDPCEGRSKRLHIPSRVTKVYSTVRVLVSTMYLQTCDFRELVRDLKKRLIARLLSCDEFRQATVGPRVRQCENAVRRLASVHCFERLLRQRRPIFWRAIRSSAGRVHDESLAGRQSETRQCISKTFPSLSAVLFLLWVTHLR